MPIETVASGNNAFAQQAIAPRPEQQQQRTEQAPPPKPPEVNEVKPAEPQETRREPPVEAQQRPPPVVNTQGQTTGRIVNTRA